MTDHEATAVPVPVIEGGVGRFERISAELPRLLEKLRHSSAWRIDQHGPLPPVPGVYLLSEDRPIYVGQTRNLRKRIKQHGGATSRENQASFAFNIARIEAGNHTSIDLGQTRKALEADPGFVDLFRAARARVAQMHVRFVEIGDPELRTVFEVYAAVALGTAEHNSFETH